MSKSPKLTSSSLVMIIIVLLLLTMPLLLYLIRQNTENRTRAAVSSEILFPVDANIINVKQAPYNARGDGVTDDTTALRNAIINNDAANAVFRSSPKTIYLPKGTYLISDSIIADNSSVRVVGAGVGQTIIKLKDNTSGFQSTTTPKIVMKSGNNDPNNTGKDFANTGFANYYQNFTLDIGSGNLGAIGIRYDVANSGAMQHVEIKSSDPQKRGKYGLFFTTSPGPAFVQDVTIDGFEHGIYLDDKMTNVLTFQDVTLRNQTTAGITNVSKNIVVENLTTQNVPVAVRTVDASATVMIINSNLGGKGTGSAINIQQKGFLYARNLISSSFPNIVTVANQNLFNAKTSLKEWSSHNYKVGNSQRSWTEDNTLVGLNLPVKKAPEFHNSDLTTWANINSFIQTGDNGDHGKALQRAIDSGKETIYFPYGTYSISSNVVVRGNVKKIDFFFSRIVRGSSLGKISVGNTNGDSVVLENVSTDVYFEQNGPDIVAIRNLNAAGGGFLTGPSATGDFFVENAGAHTKITITRPISVWARSVDRVGEWINNSGTLWCEACNIETRWSPTTLSNNSKTEIIGGAIDNLSEIHTIAEGPLLDVQNSYLSVIAPGTLRDAGKWEYLLRDQYTGGTTNLYAADLLTLYVSPSGVEKRILLPMYVTPNYKYSNPSPTTPPTSSPIPTNTLPTPTPTRIPTNTPVPGSTTISLNVLLHGIGSGGDSANPRGGGNTNPLKPQRNIKVDIYNSQNQLILTKDGTVNYNPANGSFTGNIDIGTAFPSGIYSVKLKVDQYLKNIVPGIQNITRGTLNNLPQAVLITGDINYDNNINVLDYNILIGCYSDFLPPVSCNPSQKTPADITDDGAVNQFDYNLFLRELTNITGQ